MNEWLKKNLDSTKDKWSKWSGVQKIIAAVIVVVVIGAVVLLVTTSTKPSTTRLFNAPINDDKARDAILTRLDEDHIKAYVSADNYISVEDSATAKKYRTILISEGLVPSDMDPYDIFNVSKWARTDFNNQVDWQHAQELLVKRQLESLDAIREANVTLAIPEESWITSNQNPVTASVSLSAKGSGEFSKVQVQAFQRLIATAVEGLSEENITIVNSRTGEQINDFAGMEESDRLSNIDRGLKIIQQKEDEYKGKVYNGLKRIYNDRVEVINLKIDMDLSEDNRSERVYSGITIVPDNPDTPYDDSVTVEKITLSEETITKEFTGTGYNPEGPAGVEGQNPPVYSDMSNVVGKSTEEGVKRNYALNESNRQRNVTPNIDRITVAVNIDGMWKKSYDEKGHLVIEEGEIKREYIPVSQEELAQVELLVRDSIGYSGAKGYSVTVTNIARDRTEEFEAENKAAIAAMNRNRTIMLSLVGIAVILIAFIVFRAVSREIERRRRLAEEARIRQQEEERQRALLEAQQQGMEVTMSVEERKRAELQENATAMAKEHPEDVAMLLRTWIMEE